MLKFMLCQTERRCHKERCFCAESRTPTTKLVLCLFSRKERDTQNEIGAMRQGRARAMFLSGEPDTKSETRAMRRETAMFAHAILGIQSERYTIRCPAGITIFHKVSYIRKGAPLSTYSQGRLATYRFV